MLILDNTDTVTAKCSYCKEDFIAECLSSHEQKCLDKPIRCPTCNDVVALRDWFGHECQTMGIKSISFIFIYSSIIFLC